MMRSIRSCVASVLVTCATIAFPAPGLNALIGGRYDCANGSAPGRLHARLIALMPQRWCTIDRSQMEDRNSGGKGMSESERVDLRRTRSIQQNNYEDNVI